MKFILLTIYNKMQKSIQSLSTTFLSTPYEQRINVINSMYQDAYYYDVCGDGGAILLRIRNALKNYMKTYSEDNEENLINIIYEYLNEKKLLEETCSNANNNNINYKQELKIDMLDNFNRDFKYHFEFVSKGFYCERDYLISICEECAEIFDCYMHTEPCTKCGKQWWSKSS